LIRLGSPLKIRGVPSQGSRNLTHFQNNKKKCVCLRSRAYSVRVALVDPLCPTFTGDEMSEEDDNPRNATREHAELTRWIELSNNRKGFCGTSARNTPEDKQIVEASMMQEWVEAMQESFGTIVTNVRQNPNDPPDFLATVGSEDVGVELIELITTSHLLRSIGKNPKAKKGKEAKEEIKENPQHGQLFMDTQWNRDRFESQLTDAIKKKATLYKERAIVIDVLVLYTCEPWLSAAMVEQWLQETTFEAPKNIHAAFLLMEYHPGYAEHWPVFRLF